MAESPSQYWRNISPASAEKALWFRMDQQSIASSDFTEIDAKDFLKKTWEPNQRKQAAYQSGYFGIIPYGAFHHPQSHISPPAQPPARLRVFRVHSLQHTCAVPQWAPPTKKWDLTPYTSDQHYLDTIENVLENIRDGRFYQINIIRFFKLLSTITSHDISQKLAHQGGPWSAWFRDSELELASFSPERFLHITPQSSTTYQLSTWPIKGTSPRHTDPVEDEKQKENLRTSIKEQAELHMIVDLMRNDMNRISTPHSVQVCSPGALSSFSGVHHNIAHITSTLSSFSFQQLFEALCPGGSISGTPKREVIQAIQEYEAFARRYFMGHVFYWDDSHVFHSNILIRTLVKENNIWEFAAGGGITLKSQPQQELEEIATKAASIMRGKR